MDRITIQLYSVEQDIKDEENQAPGRRSDFQDQKHQLVGSVWFRAADFAEANRKILFVSCLPLPANVRKHHSWSNVALKYYPLGVQTSTYIGSLCPHRRTLANCRWVQPVTRQVQASGYFRAVHVKHC